MMSSNQGFFNRHTVRPAVIALNKTQLPPRDPGLISFNGAGDIACAVVIIDHFLVHNSRNQYELADVLLSHLFHNFPAFPLPPDLPNYLTPSEYMNQLCLQQNTLILLVESLAFTLKRIAINHIIHHPRDYQMIRSFASQPGSIEQLASNPLYLNPWIVQALSNALPLELTLLETHEKKSLAKQRPCPDNQIERPKIHMHWQDKQCIITAQVTYRSWFESLHTTPLNVPPFTPEVIATDTTLLYKKRTSLEQENNHTLEKYTHARHRLNEMMIKQNLTEKDILALYMHSLPQPHMATSTKKNSHTVYGNQHFFEHIKPQEAIFNHEPRYACSGSMRLNRLIDALARSIALGDIPDITQKMQHRERTTMPFRLPGQA